MTTKKRRDLSSWLPWLLGPIGFQVNGVLSKIARREIVNLIGFSVEDDPENERTNIRVDCGSHLVDETAQTTTAWRDGDCTDEATAAPKTYSLARRRETTTTTADASQVLEDGAVFAGEDFSIPPDSIVKISDVVLGKKSGAAEGGSIEICRTYMRNGSSPPVLIEGDNDDPKYTFVGSTIDGTTADHVINDNAVEFQVTPESGITIHWGTFRLITVRLF